MAQALIERSPEPAEPAPGVPHRRRFGLALAALAVMALLALAAAALLWPAARQQPAGQALERESWSPWRPTATGLAGAEQIARHVGPTYRLPDGEQLALVRSGPLQIAGLPATLAVRSAPRGGSVSVVEGDSVLYSLCGLGPRCSIATGKPSVERHLLLRREALELALYTFRYLPEIDVVVALLPPRRGDPPNSLSLFRRSDLEAHLERPLQATLAPKPPSVDRIADERQRLERLTAPYLFRFTVEQGQDARPILILNPAR